MRASSGVKRRLPLDGPLEAVVHAGRTQPEDIERGTCGRLRLDRRIGVSLRADVLDKMRKGRGEQRTPWDELQGPGNAVPQRAARDWSMTNETRTLLFALLALALWYIVRWMLLERRKPAPGSAKVGMAELLIGFVCTFFDTLGIGNFATTTAMFKFRGRPADEDIPGTLNAGYAL